MEATKEEKVYNYETRYTPHWKLDIDNPTTFGNIIGPAYYYKIRRAMQEAQMQANHLIPQIAKDWKKESGYYHGDLLEYYKCEDAEHILLSMGAIGAESKIAIDELQKAGQKIGLARVRVLRPFPTEEIRKIGKQAELIVIDRNISVGLEGVLFNEVKAALFDELGTKVTGFIAGLGGKDVTYKDIEDMCQKAIQGKTKEPRNSRRAPG